MAPTKLMVPLININTNITSLNQYDVINIDQERQKANLLTMYANYLPKGKFETYLRRVYVYSVSRGTGLACQIGSCCLELPDLLTLAEAIKKQFETSDFQGSSAMITAEEERHGRGPSGT